MPAATVADGAPRVQPSHPADTPSSVITGTAGALIAQLWAPAFPSPELIDEAAALIPMARQAANLREHLLTEGPRPYIRIGPGVVEVRSQDYARAERAAERELHRREIDIELLASYLEEHGQFPDDPEPSRTITEWSRKSRANMVRTLGMLDFTPMYADRTRLPGMLTLTYPGDWVTVAPDGKTVKKHLKALRKRHQRAWGEPLRCVWKLEFQRRGAPHIHMLMVPPHGLVDGLPYYQWVRAAWVNIVAHPDPEEYAKHLGAATRVDFGEGLRASDPKRVAVYFTKHSTWADKEYQHLVPEEWHEPKRGPGRFWGYWGLRKHTAVVEVDQDVAVLAGRTLRRWSAAQQVTREVTKPRVKRGRIIPKYADTIGLAGAYLLASRDEPKYRRTRTRAGRMKNGRGFVMVNSGAEMASQLARYLDQAIG